MSSKILILAGVPPKGDSISSRASPLDGVRVLPLDVLLVPRELVPAVGSLIRSHHEPEGSEKQSLYADDNGEAGEKGKSVDDVRS
jgi:hypothetical protein